MADEDAEAQHILATIADEAEQIDAIANVRGYFLPDNQDRIHTIKSYLAGRLYLSIAVDQLASPIEESYTTADHGCAIWQVELLGRKQRTLFTNPYAAAERWGRACSSR